MKDTPEIRSAIDRMEQAANTLSALAGGTGYQLRRHTYPDGYGKLSNPALYLEVREIDENNISVF